MGEGDDSVRSWGWPDQNTLYRARYGLQVLPDSEDPAVADVAEFSAYPGSATGDHWSRHLAGEWWESKLGGNLRIIHRLSDLEGERYGRVHKFYRRAASAEGAVGR